MKIFEFVIDQEAAFAYWAQFLIDWGGYYSKKEADFYKNLGNPWGEKEGLSLQSLDSLLRQKGVGYLFLWDRYEGKEIKEEKILDAWQEIRKNLYPKFLDVWQKEESQILNWVSVLENREEGEIKKFLSKASDFFVSDEIVSSNAFTVKLMLHWDKNFPVGHSKKEYPSLLILSLSHLDVSFASRAWEVLLHEAIHHYEYKSSISSQLLRASYEKYILNSRDINREDIQNVNWKYLMLEPIVHTFANRRHYSYLGKYFSKNFSEDQSVQATEKNLDYIRNKNNFGLQIREVCERLLPHTEQYINEGKRIDANYTDSVAKIWLAVWNLYHGSK